MSGIDEGQIIETSNSGVLDLTPGDGSFAKVVVEAGLVYVGVCFNDHHVEELRKGIIKYVLEKMADEQCPGLYDVRYALFKKGSAAKVDDPANKPPKRTREPKAKADGKSKKEKKSKNPKKKSKKSSSSSSSSSDSHSDE
jgi:hypothetical protein